MRHHLAVLDEDGIIISVNEAWRNFAEANSLSWDDYGVGRSYLKVCEFAEGDNAIEARAAFKGIHGVMKNRQNEWSLEYACHSPAERRWFFMYVFRYEDKGNFRTAVIHMNITAQKLDEEKLQNSHDTLELRVKKTYRRFRNDNRTIEAGDKITNIDEAGIQKDKDTNCSSVKGENFWKNKRPVMPAELTIRPALLLLTENWKTGEDW